MTVFDDDFRDGLKNVDAFTVRKSGTDLDSSCWKANYTCHSKLFGRRDRLGVTLGVSGTRP